MGLLLLHMVIWPQVDIVQRVLSFVNYRALEGDVRRSRGCMKSLYGPLDESFARPTSKSDAPKRFGRNINKVNLSALGVQYSVGVFQWKQQANFLFVVPLQSLGEGQMNECVLILTLRAKVGTRV